MTAAELLRPPAPAGKAGTDAADEAAEPAHRRPHLVAVPDCEPPLEPLPADPDRIAAPSPRAMTFAPGPDPRPSLLMVDGDRSALRRSRSREPWDTAAVAHRRYAPPAPLPPAADDARRPRRAAPGPRSHRFHVTARDVPEWSTDGQMGVQRTASATLPPALDAGTALARGLLEALSGRRTLAQLRTLCAPDVFAGLVRLGPALAPRAQLLSAWVCQPADGVAEVTATFRCANRTRALALRLEGIDGRWRITVLDLG